MQQRLVDISGEATPESKGYHNGTLNALVDMADASGLETTWLQSSGAKRHPDSDSFSEKVELKFRPRIAKGNSTTSHTGCISGSTRPPSVFTKKVTREIYSAPVKIRHDDMQILADGNGEAVTDHIMAMMMAVEGDLNDAFAALLVANKGSFTGATGARDFNLFQTSTDAARVRGYAKMLTDLRLAQFAGRPNIIGGGLWDQMNTVTGGGFVAENNRNGTNPSGMRRHEFYFDPVLSPLLETGNEDNALIIENGSTMPVFFAQQGVGSDFRFEDPNEVRTTMVSPWTGIEWDLVMQRTKCQDGRTFRNDLEWDVILYTAYDLFTLNEATGRYASGDVLENTNGIFHAKATES